MISQPGRVECTKLANTLSSMSHDAVNRFLLREKFSGKDLMNEVEENVDFEDCVLSVDDTVLDKPYSQIEKNDLVGFFYSGKHHRSVKGINLVTLYCTDKASNSAPINFRTYDKKEKKTKNQYFQEMLVEALEAGVKPKYVTGDSWYASLENLKLLREKNIGFCFGLESDRLVSLLPKVYQRVRELDIPDNGLICHLKGFGFVKVFKKVFKEKNVKYYVIWETENRDLVDMQREAFRKLHKTHWGIEQFHRAIKQLVNIEKFAVRKARAVTNHIYCSLRAFWKLELMRIEGDLSNWYELRNNLFKPIVKDFILQI